MVVVMANMGLVVCLAVLWVIKSHEAQTQWATDGKSSSLLQGKQGTTLPQSLSSSFGEGLQPSSVPLLPSWEKELGDGGKLVD